MNSFDNNSMTSLYVWDQDSNIVFNTYIRYDKYNVLINREILYMLLSLFIWAIFVSAFFQLTEWKKKQSGKMSTRWKPGESSLFRLSKARNFLFK